MRPGERLPLLTEIVQVPGDAAPAPRPTDVAPAATPPAPGGPGHVAAELLPMSEQMARAVLELELEQALREVLEPRLSVLLRETASELALRLEPRMREWLRERGN